eukprot:9071753-Pyramimonas_sp.AAC.1
MYASSSSPSLGSFTLVLAVRKKVALVALTLLPSYEYSPPSLSAGSSAGTSSGAKVCTPCL